MHITGFALRTRPSGRVFAARLSVRGYTVFELVVVLLVLGILGASAMPRFFEAGRFEEMGYADSVITAIRHAHKVAIATRCDTRVNIDASGYGLFQRSSGCNAGSFTRTVSQPGGGDWVGIKPNGVSSGTLDVYFDAWGRPRNVTTGSLLGAAQNLSIGSRSIVLEHTTGFVRAG